MGLWEWLEENLGIVGTVLTTKWLWIMVAFGVYFIFQMYLILVSPLLILILPAGLIIYLLWDSGRRDKAQYGLKKPVVETTKWDVSNSVDNYIKTITKVQILDENRKKDES